MKKLLWAAMLFFSVSAFGQTTGKFRYDTVVFEKVGGNAEFYLRNATRGINGIMVNVGGGLVEFRASSMLNDSTIIIGLDTLVIPGGGGGGGLSGMTTNRVQFSLNSTTLQDKSTFTYNPSTDVLTTPRIQTGTTSTSLAPLNVGGLGANPTSPAEGAFWWSNTDTSMRLRIGGNDIKWIRTKDLVPGTNISIRLGSAWDVADTLDAEGGTVSEPLQQVVVGTGAAVDSYDKFLWNNTTKQVLIYGSQSSSLNGVLKITDTVTSGKNLIELTEPNNFSVGINESVPFDIGITAADNGDGTFNNVWYAGWNPFGSRQGDKIGMHLAMEHNWNNGGQRWSEFHLQTRTRNDDIVRSFSLEFKHLAADAATSRSTWTFRGNNIYLSDHASNAMLSVTKDGNTEDDATFVTIAGGQPLIRFQDNIGGTQKDIQHDGTGISINNDGLAIQGHRASFANLVMTNVGGASGFSAMTLGKSSGFIMFRADGSGIGAGFANNFYMHDAGTPNRVFLREFANGNIALGDAGNNSDKGYSFFIQHYGREWLDGERWQDKDSLEIYSSTSALYILAVDTTTGRYVRVLPSAGGADFSTDVSSSTDGQLLVFEGTTGKLGTTFSGTGILQQTSSTVSVATLSTDFTSSVTDETGSGSMVFHTSPTLVSPTINTSLLSNIQGFQIDFDGSNVRFFNSNVPFIHQTNYAGSDYAYKASLLAGQTNTNGFLISANASVTTDQNMLSVSDGAGIEFLVKGGGNVAIGATITNIAVPSNLAVYANNITSAPTVSQGIVLRDETDATNDASRFTPAVRFRNNVWDEDDGVSRPVDFQIYASPTEANTVANNLVFRSSINGAAFTTLATMTSSGDFGLGVAPSYKLDIAGDFNTTGLIRLNGSGGSAGQVLTSNGASDPTWETPSSGTTLYSGDGTLAGNRQVSSGGFSLAFGTTGARHTTWSANANNIILNANLGVAFTGPTIQMNGIPQIPGTNSGDANYTAPSTNGFITLIEITGNRTFDLSAIPTGSGCSLIIWNQNSSGNTWTLTGSVVLRDAAGTAITVLTNDTIYEFISNGTDLIRK